MKYYPTLYRTRADLDAALRGDPLVLDADGYFVRYVLPAPKPAETR